MKKILLTLVFLIFCSTIFADDLIVTADNDSINCKITKIKNGNLYYKFVDKNRVRMAMITDSEVLDYQIDFFENSEVDKINSDSRYNFDRFRLAINGGYGYQLGKVNNGNMSTEMEDYARKLKSGFNISTDVTGYFSENLGLGAKVLYFHSSNSTDNLYISGYNGYYSSVSTSDKINVFFIGPQLTRRYLDPSKKSSSYINFAMGYIQYVDNGMINNNELKMTGGAAGLVVDLGCDIIVSESMMVGFQVSILGGFIRTLNVSSAGSSMTQKYDSSEGNVSRIDFSVGLRFR